MRSNYIGTMVGKHYSHSIKRGGTQATKVSIEGTLGGRRSH